MKSGIRTIIYSGIALLFMGLFAFCCIHNGAILPEGLLQYNGEGAVEITDVKMLFEILGMIYPIMAILLLAPLSCMLLRRGCNAIGLLFAVLWSVLVFVMEIFYASDINGKAVGLFNMNFTVEEGSFGWLYLELIVICLFSCVISSVGLGEKFDELISGDYDTADRVKGIVLSIVFSNIIMTVVSFIAFIPPSIMALANYGLAGEDIPSVLHAFVEEKVSIALMLVSGVLGIIASIFIWKYIILGFKFIASGEILSGSGSGSSSTSDEERRKEYAEKARELEEHRRSEKAYDDALRHQIEEAKRQEAEAELRRLLDQ